MYEYTSITNIFMWNHTKSNTYTKFIIYSKLRKMFQVYAFVIYLKENWNNEKINDMDLTSRSLIYN